FVDALGFLSLAQIRRLAPTFWNFAHTGKFQPQRRTSLRKSVEITLDQFPFGAGFHSAHGKNTHTHDALNRAGSAPPARFARRSVNGSQRLVGVEIVVQPDLFEIIEFADFRVEDMNDDIARIDQNPVAAFEPFDPDVLA